MCAEMGLLPTRLRRLPRNPAHVDPWPHHDPLRVPRPRAIHHQRDPLDGEFPLLEDAPGLGAGDPLTAGLDLRGVEVDIAIVLDEVGCFVRPRRAGVVRGEINEHVTGADTELEAGRSAAAPRGDLGVVHRFEPGDLANIDAGPDVEAHTGGGWRGVGIRDEADVAILKHFGVAEQGGCHAGADATGAGLPADLAKLAIGPGWSPSGRHGSTSCVAIGEGPGLSELHAPIGPRRSFRLRSPDESVQITDDTIHILPHDGGVAAARCLGHHLLGMETTMEDINQALTVALRGFQYDDSDPRLQPIDDDAWPGGEKRRYGIQFTHSLTETERNGLRAHFGLALDAYVPKFVYIESVTLDTLRALSEHDSVNGVFPFAAEYKESPGVDQGGEPQLAPIPPSPQEPTYGALEPLAGPPTSPDKPARRRDGRRRPRGEALRAVLFPEANPDAVVQTLLGLGAQDIQVIGRDRNGGCQIVFTMTGPRRVPEISRLPDVSWVEEVATARPDSIAHVGFVETGWANRRPLAAKHLRGGGQVIGVIDGGGLNYNHCWFKDEPDNEPRPEHRKLINLRNASKGIGTKHANFVCGVLAGDDFAQPGSKFDRGIACDAKIAYSNRKDFELTDEAHSLYDYLRAAADTDKAHVHNTSWHFRANPEYSQDAHEVDRFAWEHEQCLVIGSSGNRGEKLGPPGSAKNPLCVSAAYVAKGVGRFGDGVVDSVADNGKITRRTWTEDGRRKPEILAPGCQHVSAGASSDCKTLSDKEAGAKAPPVTSGIPDGVLCAASFATPVASAAAAIARQYFVEGYFPSGSKFATDTHCPSGALLKALLLNSAGRTITATDYPDRNEGWGLMRLEQVLPLQDGTHKLWFRDVRHAVGLTTDSNHPYDVAVKSSAKPFKVTLVWTEPPAQVYSFEDPVVNNLDLEVRGPTGIRFLGNHFANGESAENGMAKDRDLRNNVEMVLVDQPTPGLWHIVVRGVEVNIGNPGQGYALVVTADLG
jgi:hypothetical protein